MEHHSLQPRHPSYQDHLMATSSFFNACSSAAHFACGGGGLTAPVVLHDRGWEADLTPMPLGGELFGGGEDVGTAAGSQQPWHFNGGASDGPPPPAAGIVSLDGDGDGGRSSPLWEQGVRKLASELNRDDGNVAGTRKRRDRAKTIVSERKRRDRMKEKLYELRSLVPNITKMDKASIIADAVEYVQNLQSHARKLEDEVAALPRSPVQESQNGRRAAAKRQDNDDAGIPSSGGARRGSHGVRVAHVGAARVGEGRFLVTVECERRDGAAAHLYAAVESLACFRVESSSFGRSAPDRVVSTFTLKATCQAESATIGEGTVKLLVTAALCEEGFRAEATAGIS